MIDRKTDQFKMAVKVHYDNMVGRITLCITIFIFSTVEINLYNVHLSNDRYKCIYFLNNVTINRNMINVSSCIIFQHLKSCIL